MLTLGNITVKGLPLKGKFKNETALRGIPEGLAYVSTSFWLTSQCSIRWMVW